MDYNPKLTRTAPPEVRRAAKGQIEHPGEIENVVWQTRPAVPSDYENALGDAFETVFGEGITDLDALIARLNELGVGTPDGEAWTSESFQAHMRRLDG